MSQDNAPRRYLCERCGGSGKQPAGCWTGQAYDSEAGVCQLCDGERYLGIIPESSLAVRGESGKQLKGKVKMEVTNEMVDRFLKWRLPEDFRPDGGVSFVQPNHPHSWPVGTNLLTATQAREMLEHVLGISVDEAASIR